MAGNDKAATAITAYLMCSYTFPPTHIQSAIEILEWKELEPTIVKLKRKEEEAAVAVAG